MAKGESRQVPVRFLVPRELRATYANHFLVNHQGQEFVLTFLEAVAPPILDEGALDTITEVEAVAFARIAVSGDKIPAIIDALQRNYDKYTNARSEDAGEGQHK